MASFSERHGYKPRVLQFEMMDVRLRNAIWNFLWDHFFTGQIPYYRSKLLRRIWGNFLGKLYVDLSDALQNNRDAHIDFIREWYFCAEWYEIYDIMEFILGKSLSKETRDELNSVLSREGSAYRFVGGVIIPLTNAEELTEVETALQHRGQFHVAAQHIKQAVDHLGDRKNPDARNVIKESISAVESAVGVASGDQNASIAKALNKLGLHPQLEQAWKNMYNWTSIEDGVRHGAKEIPLVGLSEARYMMVACSAFVNYLVSKDSESDTR